MIYRYIFEGLIFVISYVQIDWIGWNVVETRIGINFAQRKEKIENVIDNVEAEGKGYR